MGWMILPLKRYADFSGRSRRKEFWMFFLFYFILIIGIYIFEGVISDYLFFSISTILIAAVTLPLVIPSLAVSARRLHDTGRTGWWLLIGILPIGGAIILFKFYISDGQKGTNQFGLDPKYEDELEDVFA